MKPPPKKKNHHYVPKFVLRKFSEDGGSIHLAVIDSERRVAGAPIRSQCSEDYFYGTDPTIEDGFAEGENQAAAILGDMSRERLESLSVEDLFHLGIFTLFQKHRTVGAADEVNASGDFIFKTMGRETGTLTAEEEAAVVFRSDDPVRESLQQFLITVEIMSDLKMKFLVSEGEVGFVISDHPVIQCNQFAQFHPRFGRFPSRGGLGSMGVQLFFPLSPHVCLAVYDPGVYEYRSPTRRSCRIGPGDVRNLNTLQAQSAVECVYYNPRLTSDDELARLTVARRTAPDTKFFRDPRKLMLQFDEQAEIIGLVSPSFDLGREFAFVRVTETDAFARHTGASIPLRSSEPLKRILADLANQGDRLRSEQGLPPPWRRG